MKDHEELSEEILQLKNRLFKLETVVFGVKCDHLALDNNPVNKLVISNIGSSYIVNVYKCLGCNSLIQIKEEELIK